ncbi:hypothetical protein AJ80_05849 [Polytolypa hystricis UAMH7299]|uniref:GRF-type domain-containing protein n=1 Tax=Polytolypa hystricis (strain UAMH7299) TaxID=1447883 RepID=A0A2B7Y1I3_POLH7|nr:hypothetical protein AJ80_05849 [Polytolypa hystricis UAMH7299]
MFQSAPRTPTKHYRTANPGVSPRAAVRPRGLFVNGEWHCDCDPRLPADHFQTKKEGPNHGRWFYTCQKRQCKFFLWDDEARLRAETVILANTRSEQDGGEAEKRGLFSGGSRSASAKRIPVHTQTHLSSMGLPTPNSARKRRRESLEGTEGFETPTKSRMAGLGALDVPEGDEVNDLFWGNSGSDEFDEADFAAADSLPLTPSATRRSLFLSPGDKRHKTPQGEDKSQDGLGGTTDSSSFPSRQPDYPALPSRFSTQSSYTPNRPDITPSTPTPVRFHSTPLSKPPPGDTKDMCPLVSQTLTLLSSYNTSLPPPAKQDLITLLNTHDLRTQGIARGRDISRSAIKKKDEKIQALTGRIEVLEAEREAWRMKGFKGPGGQGSGDIWKGT